MYLPENRGICHMILGISFDFPPLYLIIGFIFVIFCHKVNQNLRKMIEVVVTFIEVRLIMRVEIRAVDKFNDYY